MVTIHDLYETYPNFHIQVKFEQDLLLAHDIIVFHHPFYWYSSPAILKVAGFSTGVWICLRS